MTLSLRLDKRLKKKLTQTAKAQGISTSELIRRCLSEYLADEEQQPGAWELGKDLFGCFDSRRGDLSARAKKIAREHAHAKHAAAYRR